MSGNFQNIYDVNNIPRLEERFETALEAQEYAKKNLSVIITRAFDNNGYIIKTNYNSPEQTTLDKNIKFNVDINLLHEIANITPAQLREIISYISIFLNNGFNKLYKVNKFISNYNRWDDFSNIRSKNDYDSCKEVEGINPQFFSIVSKLLQINNTSSRKLDKAKKW